MKFNSIKLLCTSGTATFFDATYCTVLLYFAITKIIINFIRGGVRTVHFSSFQIYFPPPPIILGVAILMTNREKRGEWHSTVERFV